MEGAENQALIFDLVDVIWDFGRRPPSRNRHGGESRRIQVGDYCARLGPMEGYPA